MDLRQQPVTTDGVTITGEGTAVSPLVAVSTSSFFPKVSAGIVDLTGTVTDTQLVRITIPANTLSSSDTFDITSFVSGSAISTANKLFVKLGTTNVYASASAIALLNAPIPNYAGVFKRTFTVISGTLYAVSSASSVANDSISTGLTSVSSLPFNPAVDNYIFVGCQLDDIGGSSRLYSVTLSK